MKTASKTHEEGSENAAGVDDFLTVATNWVRSALQEDPDNPSIFSIWGWDGVGRSIIANKIMEEAKKEGEAYLYDVVISVSVPPSQDDVPKMRKQQKPHLPTSRDSKMAFEKRILAEEPFGEEFPEEERKKIEEFRACLKTLDDKIKTKVEAKDMQKTLTCLEAGRLTLPVTEPIELSGIVIKPPVLRSIRARFKRLEEMEEIEREANEIQTGLEKIGEHWQQGRPRASEKQKEEERRYLEQEIDSIRKKEKKTVREESKRELAKLSRSLKEEAKRELNEERRRLLNEQRKVLEEVIRRLKEEGERQLEEERSKARKELERELRQRELRAKIVAELMINVGQSTHTAAAAAADVLWNWLASRRFLLILKDVWENIDLEEIGIPLPAPGNGSKVIIIPTPTAEEAVKEQMQAMVIKEKFSNLYDSQAWQLLKAEAVDAATALPFYPSIIMSTSSILECFTYISLFPRRGTRVRGSSLKQFWRSEGFFDELTARQQGGGEGVQEVMDALLVQLSKRCMLTSFDGNFQMPDDIWQLVSSCKGLLIRCDSDSEMLPGSNEWEGAVRISLSHNTQIHELPMKPIVRPPNCPKLQTLFLNDNDNLISISPNFFENMTRLQVLDLSSTAINSLPASISNLHKLRMLNLGSCSQLEDLPEFLKHMQKLEILDLRRTPIKRMSLDGMPSLRRLDISAAKCLTQLSVNGCGSLSILKGLEELSELQEMDLSGTKINQLPHEIFNMSSLKRLHLLRMQHLKKIPWGRIARLPEQLQWHQCGSYSLKEQFPGNNKCLVSATDAALFNSLGPDSKLSESHLQNFYFLVCPCESRPKDRFADFKTRAFPYERVFASQAISARLDWFLRCLTCIEICGGKAPINGIGGLLLMADSFRLRGHEFINKVFHLGLKAGNVRQCWIEKCNQLECVIDLRGGAAAADILGSLENLWLSDLPKLITVCRAIPRSTSSACLKHLYLECCPKLINFFSSNIHFQNLESLEIKFCPRLESLFGDGNVVGQDAFPQLAEIRLWELSKIKRICNGHLPMLKKLKIRGCPMLGNLPLLNEATSAAAAIEIEGETKWWESIRWEGGAKPRNICFKDCSSFQV